MPGITRQPLTDLEGWYHQAGQPRGYVEAFLYCGDHRVEIAGRKSLLKGYQDTGGEYEVLNGRQFAQESRPEA